MTVESNLMSQTMKSPSSRVPSPETGTPALSAQSQGALTTGAFAHLSNPVHGGGAPLFKPTRRAGLYHPIFHAGKRGNVVIVRPGKRVGLNRFDAFFMEQNRHA